MKNLNHISRSTGRDLKTGTSRITSVVLTNRLSVMELRKEVLEEVLSELEYLF
jgi:hypothetical protein